MHLSESIAYDTVRPSLAGFRGAYVNTRRLLALVAPHREGAHVNYPSLLGLAGDQFHPGDPQRKKMLDSASSDAAMAAATLHKVNNHSPSDRSFRLFSLFHCGSRKASFIFRLICEDFIQHCFCHFGQRLPLGARISPCVG